MAAPATLSNPGLRRLPFFLRLLAIRLVGMSLTPDDRAAITCRIPEIIAQLRAMVAFGRFVPELVDDG